MMPRAQRLAQSELLQHHRPLLLARSCWKKDVLTQLALERLLGPHLRETGRESLSDRCSELPAEVKGEPVPYVSQALTDEGSS